jgi:hypothetical protein
MMIVGVKRGDLEVEDHLEIPLDPNDDGEIELAIDYAGDPPSCVFDLDFAVSEGGVVSDYTTAEQVSDTVPPPTATPVPTATAGATAVPTTNVTSTSTALATPTATATTATATPTTTPSATAPTATATPGATFAYALTTNDDRSHRAASRASR